MTGPSSKARLCPNCGSKNLVLNGYGYSATGRKPRWSCIGPRPDRKHCYTTTDPSRATTRGRQPDPEPVLIYDPETSSKVVIATWAQNATPAHKGFLKALRVLQKSRKADLRVTMGRYKNPTSRWPESVKNAQWWAPELVPYLINKRKNLNRNLQFLADIPIEATSSNPLGGLEALSHGESSIVGHPRVELRVVPVPHQKIPKILTTTGSVTVANYTETPRGKKGEFHHVLGAVLTELADNGTFHLRHLNARGDGAFCDFDLAYHPDGSIRPAGPYPALIFGDTHVRFTDPIVTRATFGPGGLVARLNPNVMVFHDLADHYAVNPHHDKKPFIAFAKYMAGYSTVEDEIREVAVWIKRHAGKRETRIVASNHNDFLARWMNSHDWRTDPANAKFYAETLDYMLNNTRMGEFGAEVPDPFTYWMNKLLADSPNIKCLGRHEPLVVGGILLSLHGDEGANGARGSLAGFSRMGVKSVTGHSHKEGIHGGAMSVSTSTRTRLEYTCPISSSTQAHIGIDPFMKRHLYRIINGRFWP